MAAQGVRIIAVASFLPAFPLLLADGIVSRSPVPATGLVPLAFSSGLSLYMVARKRVRSDRADYEEEPHDFAVDSGQYFLVFLADVVLAASLLVVLVFSWLDAVRLNGQQAMLSAYATIPLLINLFTHFYFVLKSFSAGLALHDLTQYLAWHLVPARCPDCRYRLRPESAPKIPWLELAKRIFRSSRTVVSSFKAPPAVASWNVPAWLKRTRSDEDAPLIVDEEAGEVERYRDEPDEGEPSTRVEEPDEVAVVAGKKSKKAKESPLPAGDENDEPRW